MSGFLLAIMISGAVSGTSGSVPLGLFSDVQDCIDTAAMITDADILKDEHDLWCIPVKIQDGYASGEGDLEILN